MINFVRLVVIDTLRCSLAARSVGERSEDSCAIKQTRSLTSYYHTDGPFVRDRAVRLVVRSRTWAVVSTRLRCAVSHANQTTLTTRPSSPGSTSDYAHYRDVIMMENITSGNILKGDDGSKAQGMYFFLILIPTIHYRQL